MAGLVDYPRRSRRGEPVWELATLYPEQGGWSEEEYLRLDTNRLVEYDNGVLEFLPMPKISHQRIVRVLFLLLESLTKAHGGEVFTAPTRLKVSPRKYREPDLVYVLDASRAAGSDDYFQAADLVMEVVSEGADSHERDYVKKRRNYAAAGIPEYWIVDPHMKRVTVLVLARGKYAKHAEAGPGETAQSAMFKELRVRVSDLFGK